MTFYLIRQNSSAAVYVKMEIQVCILSQKSSILRKPVPNLALVKESTLERAAFHAGWSELSWSGLAQLALA